MGKEDKMKSRNGIDSWSPSNVAAWSRLTTLARNKVKYGEPNYKAPREEDFAVLAAQVRIESLESELKRLSEIVSEDDSISIDELLNAELITVEESK